MGYLSVKLDVEIESGEDAAAWAEHWFRSMVSALLPGVLEQVEEAVRADRQRWVYADGYPEDLTFQGWVGPAGAYGGELVQTWGSANLRLKSRKDAYTARRLEGYLKRAGRDSETSTVLRLEKFTSLGTWGFPPPYVEADRVIVRADRRSGTPEYLSLEVQLSDLRVESEGGERQQRLLEAHLEVARGGSPIYGEVGYAHPWFMWLTPFEWCLPRWPGGPWVPAAAGRQPLDPIVEAREFLRGYGWVTVVPAEMAERLGGRDGVMASGAFARVEALPGGGLWLLATPTLAEYGKAEAERVWRALAPVLRSGHVDAARVNLDFTNPDIGQLGQVEHVLPEILASGDAQEVAKAR